MLTLKSEPTLAVPGEVLPEGTDFEEQAVNYPSNTHGGLAEIEGQWYI